jgi:hypothetical protein
VSSQSRQPGCFSYGCLIATVIVVVLGSFLTWWGIRSIKAAVELYTTPVAARLSDNYGDSPSENTASGDKVARLFAALEVNYEFSTTLTSADLNEALRVRGLEKNVRVGLEGNRLSMSFSLPLGLLGEWSAARIIVPDIESRHISGMLLGEFEIADGVPNVNLDKFVLNNNVFDEMAREHASTWLGGALVSAFADLPRIQKVITRESMLFVELSPVRGGKVD